MFNSKNYSHFVGIDMSKLFFDGSILASNGFKVGHKRFNNSAEGFKSFLEWVRLSTENSENILFVMEYTGIYSRMLMIFLQDNDCSLWMESGFRISRAAGIRKTKNDKFDSYMIAEYALNRQYKVKLMPKYDEDILLLHDLLSNRNRLIVGLNALRTPMGELIEYGNKRSVDILEDLNKEAIEGIKKSIKQLEAQIKILIDSREDWRENYDLACSVRGVGKWIVAWMIVYTRNFSKEFTARKFCSMAGIAPFENSSGTALQKGDHVSQFSHKNLKAMLHSVVMSAIRHNPNIKAYHQKKKNEGKKGFVSMNNVKNKIVHTIFAVVRTKTLFDIAYRHKLSA